VFTIYRPYTDIEKSVQSLSEEDLHLVGRLNISIMVKAILAELGLIIYDTDLLKTNETAKWYWNGGEPFLNDLVYYYNVAEELWLDAGGGGHNYLEDCEDILENCDYIVNEAKWNEHNARLHQLVMLRWDRQWYKRKFRDVRNLEIIDASLFVNGTPRKMTVRGLTKHCRVLENV
jgi:hypothetical protein